MISPSHSDPDKGARGAEFRFRSSAADACGSSPADDPLKPLLRSLGELKEYIGYYLSSQGDAVQLKIRQGLLWAVLGIACGLVGLAALITSVVLLLDGVAEGLAILFGDRLWAGELVTGAAILILAAIAAYFVVARITKTSRQRIIQKYERRRQKQRVEFGRDVSQRAAHG